MGEHLLQLYYYDINLNTDFEELKAHTTILTLQFLIYYLHYYGNGCFTFSDVLTLKRIIICKFQFSNRHAIVQWNVLMAVRRPFMAECILLFSLSFIGLSFASVLN